MGAGYGTQSDGAGRGQPTRGDRPAASTHFCNPQCSTYRQDRRRLCRSLLNRSISIALVCWSKWITNPAVGAWPFRLDCASSDDIHKQMDIMEHTMRVSKWGNSLPIRLPGSVVQALELKEGDEVEVHVAGERAFDIARDRSRERALERIRAFRKQLPADWKFFAKRADALQ